MKSLSDFPLLLQKRLENTIDKVIRELNLHFNLKTKQASFISTPAALQVAHGLWNEAAPRRRRGESTRKKAATALVMAAFTGGRWIDIHRLQWQDLKKSRTSTMLFITAEMRLSKNNQCNEVPQRMVWARPLNDKSTENPITWIHRLWVYQGKPKSGFIFKPQNPRTKVERWGDATIEQVQQMAEKLNIPTTELPSKHSARVTMAVTLFNMGVESQRINRFMNWKTSRMQERYINTRDSQLPGAPAHRLASISNRELAQIQKDLI